MKADTLSLACDRIFKKVEKVSNTRNGKEHKAFLDLWKLIKKEDYEISLMFDDMKRSNAFHKLTAWKRNAVISEEDFSKYLYTADLPDPELLIRTGGEFRVSNFLLWQIAYTEFYIIRPPLFVS